MIIELGTLDEGPRPFEFSLRAGGTDLDLDNARVAGPVTARGVVVQRTAQTEISGVITAKMELDCVRCLGPVESRRKIEFEVAYVAPEHFATDKEKEVTTADLVTDVLPGNSIDLTEVVREQIVLDLPIQAFCSEDCKGLCATCGVNLNLIDCKCKESGFDPRWEALKNLR